MLMKPSDQFLIITAADGLSTITCSGEGSSNFTIDLNFESRTFRQLHIVL